MNGDYEYEYHYHYEYFQYMFNYVTYHFVSLYGVILGSVVQVELS